MQEALSKLHLQVFFQIGKIIFLKKSTISLKSYVAEGRSKRLLFEIFCLGSECYFGRLNLQCFQTVCIVVGRSGSRADEGVGPSTFGHLLASSRDLARARL